MKKRVLCSILMAGAVMAAMASAENIGTYYQMGTLYDEPIVWRCVDEDENGSLLLADEILTLRPFDAKGTHDNDYRFLRKNFGSNRWENSNLRDWLNSDAPAGEVQWSCGNAPSEGNVWGGYNEYDTEPGFLNGFTEAEKAVIKEISLKELLSWRDAKNTTMATDGTEVHISYSGPIEGQLKNFDNAFSYTLTEKVFLLDVKQLYKVWGKSDILGDRYYIGVLSKKCAENNEYPYSVGAGGEWHTWLRTPFATYIGAETVRHLWNNGWIERAHPYLSYIGVRPAIYVDAENVSEGEGTKEAPYILGK